MLPDSSVAHVGWYSFKLNIRRQSPQILYFTVGFDRSVVHFGEVTGFVTPSETSVSKAVLSGSRKRNASRKYAHHWIQAQPVEFSLPCDSKTT